MEITELLQTENSILLVKTEDLQKLADLLADRVPQQPQPLKQEVEQPMSFVETEEWLGKTRQTLTKWRKRGIIQGHTLGGRVYFLKSELLEALNKKRA